MSTEAVALYRKYRPQKFKEVKGQEHVVSVLEGAIANDSIAHAYLFAGSRGTGKTSVARIFSHALGVSDNDLYEIDAASNRGIDDIRELREAVSVLPLESPYKVYLVDEVHMLTKEAFNALLKTLEEPPKHVLFILATTEIDRLPETVVSRCQTFTFKKPTQAVLRQAVLDTAKKEGVTLEKSAAELIALLADGSFRDAHGVLQKVLSSTEDKEVSVAEVEMVTGAPKGELVNKLVQAIADQDAESGLTQIADALDQNIDMILFTKLVLQKVRYVLLLRYAPGMEKKIGEKLSDEDLKLLTTLSKEKTIHSETLKTLLEAQMQMGRAYLPQLPLELALVRLAGVQ